jgi:hypothetical protein
MRDRAAVPEPSGAEPASAPARAPGRAAEILALQRTIGNAATGRWLARKPADPVEANWTDICAGNVPAPVANPDPYDPMITTVAGPCLTHWAGGYAWWVTYKLGTAAPKEGGYIVQELTMENSEGGFSHFWESWRVAPNASEPPMDERPTMDRPPGLRYDDRSRTLMVPGGNHAPQGWFRHLGIVRFYPGPLDPEFVGGQAKTRPRRWTGAGTRHDLFAEWDRRPGRRRKLGFVAFAGPQAIRLGDTDTGFSFLPALKSP